MKSQSYHGHIISFDFGKKRIGVAIANTEIGHIEPLTTITAKDYTPDWATLDKLIETWQPTLLVVGKAGASDSYLREKTLTFATTLTTKYNLPVDFAEEDYSSIEAEHLLKQAKSAGTIKKISKKDIDKIAATLILETWLSCHH